MSRGSRADVRGAARPDRQPSHLRRQGWDADQERPPFAQVTASQRFVDPGGEREWLLLHVAPNERGVAARVLVTSSSGPAWVEPQADGFWSDDDGFVSAFAWHVADDPSYDGPASSYPVRDGRPWCHYAVWYPPSGARAATRVRDAFFLALVVAASPVIAGWLVVDALRERRRERAFVLSLPPNPPSPGRLPGPSDDDDLALRGALRSGRVRLVVRALSRGTVLVPASADGSVDDGRLHVFSSVAALDAWTGSSGKPYEVVAGEGLVALAARRGAAAVSLDAGSDHHLEIPAAELARHLAGVGAPRPG